MTNVFRDEFAKLEPSSVKRIFDTFEKISQHARYLYFWVLWKWQRKEFLKLRKHQIFLTNCIQKALVLAQYTKQDEAILKDFWESIPY